MNILAIVYLVALVAALASDGAYYDRRPAYNWSHPGTWVVVLGGMAAISLTVWTLA